MKPPPVIETASGRAYASMNLAAILLARAARVGASIPDSCWAQISALPHLRVDGESISRDGYDVIFRAFLKLRSAWGTITKNKVIIT